MTGIFYKVELINCCDAHCTLCANGFLGTQCSDKGPCSDKFKKRYRCKSNISLYKLGSYDITLSIRKYAFQKY